MSVLVTALRIGRNGAHPHWFKGNGGWSVSRFSAAPGPCSVGVEGGGLE